mmetsp:Transcript_30635/g.88420  ORF Transcript_30635/g.88420 Transcript_30635/m.88420 type:complete len:250 (+) Transcript_30635:2488-3237(+)
MRFCGSSAQRRHREGPRAIDPSVAEDREEDGRGVVGGAEPQGIRRWLRHVRGHLGGLAGPHAPERVRGEVRGDDHREDEGELVGHDQQVHPRWPEAALPEELLLGDGADRCEGVEGEPVADHVLPRPTGAGRSLASADGNAEVLAVLRAVRYGQPDAGLHRGPLLGRHPAAGVLLPLHGGARGLGRHRRKDLAVGLLAAVLSQAPRVSDGRLRLISEGLGWLGRPVPLRRGRGRRHPGLLPLQVRRAQG